MRLYSFVEFLRPAIDSGALMLQVLDDWVQQSFSGPFLY